MAARKSRKFEDLTGFTRDELTAIEFVGQSGGDKGQRLWKCQCSCGSTVIRTVGDIKSSAGRKSCGCLAFKGPKESNHPAWKGHEGIWGSYWSKLQYSAATRGHGFSVSIEEAWELYVYQGKVCALSGQPIFFGRRAEGTASLDRIDSSIGYVAGNIQWVHKDINKMKNVLGQDYFIDLCKKVADTWQ